uniref:Uncharacterized protein n=1 Tax=Rhizophora mucronata TaxID=61149 RepID=A0A2P2LYT9_RHIMU
MDKQTIKRSKIWEQNVWISSTNNEERDRE